MTNINTPDQPQITTEGFRQLLAASHPIARAISAWVLSRGRQSV